MVKSELLMGFFFFINRQMGNVYHHHGRMGLASCPARYFNNDPEIECVPFASGWMCRNSDDVSVSINHQLTRMEFGDPYPSLTFWRVQSSGTLLHFPRIFTCAERSESGPSRAGNPCNVGKEMVSPVLMIGWGAGWALPVRLSSP